MTVSTAVLLLDLQADFLDTAHGRMPVPRGDALRVIAASNEVLSGKLLAGALPVLVVNHFPAGAKVANFFRHGAAIAGSPGAALDPRIGAAPNLRIFEKAQSNAFTNPDLEPYLRERGVGVLWVMGVYAEGCVRATALAARRLGFEVVVAEAGMATNAAWKAAFARWSLRRGGVTLVPALEAKVRAV
jgi:nicotinamidase-related amidase